MNRQIRSLGVGLMVLFCLLFVQLNLVQVVRADRYDADPGNNRAVVRDFTRPRGSILTADGVVIAESVPSTDRYRYQRRVPDRRAVRQRQRLLLASRSARRS